MLTDSNRGTVKKDREVALTRTHWGEKQKLNCVTTYVMCGGNVILTAMTTGIPEQTIYKWKDTEWWNKFLKEVKLEEKLTLSTKLKKVVDSSWEIVAERLEKGNLVLNKHGELIRVPVSLRDAAKVATDSCLVREKLELNESFTTNADNVQEKLNVLAKAFSDLASGKKPPAEVVEMVEELPPEQLEGN